MRDDEFDVGYWLLDDELIDSDGRRCGRVDDVELEGGPGDPARIAAILSGPGALRERLPRWVKPLARRLFTDDVVRVDWSEVSDIQVVVELKRPAGELGLGRGDDAFGEIVNKIPGS